MSSPCAGATHPHPVLPAGVRTNLLTLQPALRTLTHDYNSLKRQVRDFPLLLQETLRSARAEVSPGSAHSPSPCVVWVGG